MSGAGGDSPVIIEVALTTRPDRNSTAPSSLADAAEQGLACIDAGASIVHMHLPDLKASASEATAQYLECFRPNVDRATAVVTPRAEPLTDDDIQDCERRFAAVVGIEYP